MRRRVFARSGLSFFSVVDLGIELCFVFTHMLVLDVSMTAGESHPYAATPGRASSDAVLHPAGSSSVAASATDEIDEVEYDAAWDCSGASPLHAVAGPAQAIPSLPCA